MASNLLKVLGAACLLVTVACGGSTATSGDPETAEAAPERQFERGIVSLFPKSNSKVRGQLVFRETPSGLAVKGNVDGLEGGQFAISVHSGADCSAFDGKSVGPVLNPGATKPPAGLVGNAIAPVGVSQAKVDLVTPKLHLQGGDAVLGHAVVVHAWPSDPEVDWQRVPFLACGVVEGG